MCLWAVHTLSFRYYYLLDSYSKLLEACMDVGASSDKWLRRLAISSWLTHIKEIFNCGCLIAQVLEKVHFFPCCSQTCSSMQEKASVVVYRSDGMAITLCVSVLAQVILNLDCNRQGLQGSG